MGWGPGWGPDSLCLFHRWSSLNVSCLKGPQREALRMSAWSLINGPFKILLEQLIRRLKENIISQLVNAKNAQKRYFTFLSEYNFVISSDERSWPWKMSVWRLHSCFTLLLVKSCALNSSIHVDFRSHVTFFLVTRLVEKLCCTLCPYLRLPVMSCMRYVDCISPTQIPSLLKVFRVELEWAFKCCR